MSRISCIEGVQLWTLAGCGSAFGVAALLISQSACVLDPDVVAIRLEAPSDDMLGETSDAATVSGNAAEAPEEFQVTGRPLQNWPFVILPWPLETSLEELFGNGRVARLQGDDAVALLQLWEPLQKGELGPSHSVLGVRDNTGVEYLITLKAR